LEGALRLVGYGHPTGFFQKIRDGGHEWLVNNETFSLRFFPPQLARWPGPIMMEASKPPDTYRIFILGESAARGEPEPPYSAGRYLEILLQERFPGQKFEVVNVAITAINSHVILPIARELARQKGDLWIIYMGNNEMVGPFGAVTVFGAQAPPLGLVRLSLAIQQTRVGQLLMTLARKARGKAATAPAWGGMKMFLGNEVRPDAPRKQVVYRSFESNLHDIVRAGLDSGAKVMLNTVAVNLKDCPPFASPTNSILSSADQAAWEKAYADGCRAADRGNLEEAGQCFERAARLDSLAPDLQFRWGECLLALTNFTAAREHLQLACDYDGLPFRADSRINRLIREEGKRSASPDLDLFDAAAVMATNTPAGISGQELFYEHVHFNLDGNYQLGLGWAEQVERLLPEAIRHRAVGSWVTQEICDHRLGLTDWNRCAVVMTVMDRLHRQPFSNQLGNERRLATLQAQANALRNGMTPRTAAQARADFLAALSRAPDDHWLRENFAEFLESIGDVKQATAEWQQVRALLPHNCYAYYKVGQLLAQQGSAAEAENSLLKAVALRPSLTEGWFELGNLYLDTGRFGFALPAYERARQLEPQEALYYALVGKALSKLNRRAEAIDQYRQAIRLKPSLAEAHFALGDELAASNQIAEAEKEYEQVVQLQPTNTLGHLNVGVMLARQGQFDPALRHFAETLRLDPANKLAQEYFDRVQGWKNRKP
jgi:tetratricopeptide (TPR) repeat protein